MRNSLPRLRPLALVASMLALTLGAGAAVAQTAVAQAPAPPPAAPATMTAPPAHTHMSLKERFAAANVTNDGRLTLVQAQSGLPMVARNFPAIDKDNKGYVTVTDIQSFMREQRAARRAATPSSTNG